VELVMRGPAVWRGTRWAALAIGMAAVLGAILTPPDRLASLLTTTRAGTLVFYEESRGGTVAVVEQQVGHNRFKRLYIDGVSNSGDGMASLRYMRLQALVPLLVHTGESRTALVVDDSRAIREAMTSMLGSEGWIVDVAEDGARALQLARHVRYDLVVSDLEMPDLGGFELIAKLRQDERYHDTPVVIITSRANPEHRRRARDLGVRALVAKPITRRKLLEALAAREAIR